MHWAIPFYIHTGGGGGGVDVKFQTFLVMKELLGVSP